MCLSRSPIDNFQHWFRWWLGADKAKSHRLNQWWVSLVPAYASLDLSMGCYVKLAPELVRADATPWLCDYIKVKSRRSCRGVRCMQAINFYNENLVQQLSLLKLYLQTVPPWLGNISPLKYQYYINAISFQLRYIYINQNKPDTPSKHSWICPLSKESFLIIKHTRIINVPIT